MNLQLTLTPDLQQRLSREAQRRGVSADKYALFLLERSLPPDESRAKLIDLLQSWNDDDEMREPQDSDVDLTRPLDEDRLSDRKLFPPELKGVTW